MTLRARVVAAMVVLAAPASAQTRQYALESVAGIRLHNVTAEPALLDGRKGLRVSASREALANLTPEELANAELLAVVGDAGFTNGVIEAEIAGAVAPGAAEGARGFVGLAFRLQQDMKTYDAFYLRPTNGRANDQERRNHATQYVSHPAWPWFRLRKETPGRYESYVDLVPGAWTKIRIEVSGEEARLYVHGQEQPALVVNDMKSGREAKGVVALWIGPGTVAHFRNLRVETKGR